MVESPDMPSPLRVQKTNFQHRSQKIDWRKLASVDLETMSQNGDFAVLQDNIQHVTFCDVREEFPNVDLNLVKLFRLAQLIIQYFLQSQDALINSISDLRSSVSSRTKEAEDAEAATALALSELKTLRKENKFLKRTLYKESCEGGSYPWKCGACPKIFISGEYLKAHVERRHGGDPVAAVPLQPSSRISTGVVNVESRNVEAEEESRRLLEENAHLSRELALLRDELSEQEVRLRREISSSVNKGLALGLAEQRSHEISEDIAREIQKLKEVLFTELQTRRPDFSEERKRLELKAESQEKEIQELRKLLESEVPTLRRDKNSARAVTSRMSPWERMAVFVDRLMRARCRNLHEDSRNVLDVVDLTYGIQGAIVQHDKDVPLGSDTAERVGSEQLQKLSMENQHRLEAQLRDIDDKYHRGLEKLESCIQNQRDGCTGIHVAWFVGTASYPSPQEIEGTTHWILPAHLSPPIQGFWKGQKIDERANRKGRLCLGIVHEVHVDKLDTAFWMVVSISAHVAGSASRVSSAEMVLKSSSTWSTGPPILPPSKNQTLSLEVPKLVASSIPRERVPSLGQCRTPEQYPRIGTEEEGGAISSVQVPQILDFLLFLLNYSYLLFLLNYSYLLFLLNYSDYLLFLLNYSDYLLFLLNYSYLLFLLNYSYLLFLLNYSYILFLLNYSYLLFLLNYSYLLLPKRASGGSRPRPSPPVLEEAVQKEESLGTVKEDVTSDLTERLQRAGIPGDAWTIEESKLAATMAQIKRERKEFEKEMPKYSSVQSTLNRSIDQQIRLQGVTPPRRHKERGFRTVIHSIRKRVLGGSAFSWRHHDGKSRSLEALAKSLPHSAEPKLFNAEKESQRFGGSTPALNTASSRHTLGVVQPSYTPSDLEYDDDLDSVDAERGTPIDTDFHRRGDQGRRVHFSRPGASFENESTSDWSDEEEEPILKKIPVQTLPKASSKLEQDASLEDVEEEILEEFYGDPSPNVKPKIALRKTSSWDSE
ncbi:unnamed protein product [Cyprideis torosa]|uniref:Uncharacterized protein n=1 Tax=Cyprideis torosa TaxID=163714 RepID=A0A7R8ZKF7_9CRUS|nr:unnamed protein product [Cyprideis torosa]CAG0889267.1 unnamed protein product [Cyprideis torosa]